MLWYGVIWCNLNSFWEGKKRLLEDIRREERLKVRGVCPPPSPPAYDIYIYGTNGKGSSNGLVAFVVVLYIYIYIYIYMLYILIYYIFFYYIY